MEHTSTVIDLVSAVTTLLLVAAAVLALSKRLRLPFTVIQMGQVISPIRWLNFWFSP